MMDQAFFKRIDPATLVDDSGERYLRHDVSAIHFSRELGQSPTPCHTLAGDLRKGFSSLSAHAIQESGILYYRISDLDAYLRAHAPLARTVSEHLSQQAMEQELHLSSSWFKPLDAARLLRSHLGGTVAGHLSWLKRDRQQPRPDIPYFFERQYVRYETSEVYKHIHRLRAEHNNDPAISASGCTPEQGAGTTHVSTRIAFEDGYHLKPTLSIWNPSAQLVASMLPCEARKLAHELLQIASACERHQFLPDRWMIVPYANTGNSSAGAIA